MPEMFAEQAIGDNSVVYRFLKAAGRSEIESAEKTLQDLKTAPEAAAIAQIIDERRGDAADLVLQAVAMGASSVVGHALGQTVNKYAAMAPGAAMITAALFAKQPYAVRAGLLASGLAWISGAKK